MLEKCKISGFADEIDTSLENQIKVLKELNVNFVEFRSAGKVGIADYTEKMAKEAFAKLKNNGISVSALGSPIGKIGIDDDFEKHFELFKRVVELSDIFETKYIRMFSFYMPTGKDPSVYKNKVIDRLGVLKEYAEKSGVVLLHENEKGIYGDIASRCKEIFEVLYGYNFKCTFDFANFVQCGQDTLQAYLLLENYIEYVHVKDAIGQDVVPAGKGDGNVQKILSLLDKRGYDGFLSLEPHLGDFWGLKELSTHEQINGRLMKGNLSGEDKFKIAYNALKEILAQK